MYKTIDKYQFRDAFNNMGRKKQFSYEALDELFDYYNEIENYELDVIGICCEWMEYDTVDELRENYSQVLDDVEDEDALEAVERETTVIPIDIDTGERRFLVQEF